MARAGGRGATVWVEDTTATVASVVCTIIRFIAEPATLAAWLNQDHRARVEAVDGPELFAPDWVEGDIAWVGEAFGFAGNDFNIDCIERVGTVAEMR